MPVEPVARRRPVSEPGTSAPVETSPLAHAEDIQLACLADIVRVHASQRRHDVALECGSRRLTWEQWRTRAARVCAGLGDLGVGPGARVAVLARNGLAIFEITFGAAMRNAVAVQVNWRLAPPEVAQVLDDSEADVFFVAEEFLPAVERIRPGLAHVRHLVVIGDHGTWPTYEDWVQEHAPEDPGTVGDDEDVAMQLYTSGTTGLPKGVMLTNRNVLSMVQRVNRWWGLDAEGAVNLALMPLFHIAGLGWSVAGLAVGCRTVILPDVEVGAIVRAIRGGVTHAFMVPAVIQLLVGTPNLEHDDFASLRTLVYGASPISAAVITKAAGLLGCELVQVYGLTETTGAVTQLDAADHDPVSRPHLLRSCGRPFPWVEVRVVDPATGDEVTTGSVGELWIRSVQVMAGYWKNPVATQEAIDPAGWFKTGDAGYRDAEGYLYLYDRVKDMIVTGGENVYPAEVENALMAHPQVADVAVIGVPDERWGEAVKAIVVPAADPAPQPSELIAFCRDQLAGYKCPRSVEFAATLPRNPSGKLLKRELRRPYWEGFDRFVS